MTGARYREIMYALEVVESVKSREWLQFMKNDEDKLPYRIADVSKKMYESVRTLCPPGFEIDR